MNIYVNGDSYAAGFELADTVLPSFPGFQSAMNRNNNNYATWALDRKNEGVKYYGSAELLIKAGKDLAWPAELTKINPNIKVYNGAKTGASITGITNRTIKDLIKHRNNNIKFDYIFIQLTSPDRYEFHDANATNVDYVQDGAIINIPSLQTEKQRQFATSFFKLHYDADLAVKYLYAVSTLKYAVKGITGIEPIFLVSAKFFVNHVVEMFKKLSLGELIEDSKINDLNLYESMDHIQAINNFLFLPLGHYEQSTHQAYARLIYDRYIAK